MDKEFLIRILHTSSRVILPGFGAFLRKSQGGSIIFTPFLKSDDGFLSSELISEYGISKDDSKEMIDAYVSHIKEVMQSSGRYTIQGAGTLIMDSNGAIAFSEDMSRQITSPKPEVVTEPTIAPTPEPEIRPKPIVEKVAETPKSEPLTPPRPKMVNVPPIQHSAVTPKPITTIRRPAPQPQPPVQPTPQPRPSTPPQRPVNQHQRPTAPQRPVNSQPQRPRPTNPRQQPPQQHRERPLPRSPKTPQKGKYDMWLIVAIVAALIAIGLLIFGFITSSSVNDLQL